MLTYLVVDHHDRDEHRVRPDGCFELLQVDQAVFFHGQVRHLEAPVLQITAAVQDALVCSKNQSVLVISQPVLLISQPVLVMMCAEHGELHGSSIPHGKSWPDIIEEIITSQL